MENNKLLSIGQAAKILGISIQTLRRWDEKGRLKAFRITPTGRRFYREEEIKILTRDLPALGWGWAYSAQQVTPDKEFYCPTSDIFIARLLRLENDLKKMPNIAMHYSLLVSSAGEIGDNSYAHNIGNWPDILGIFFAYDINKKIIVLADRGRGILETLKAVRPELSSHDEALKVAFTEIISGRFPERRGNGLKSVLQNIEMSDAKLVFATGDARLELAKGNRALNITKCDFFHGCFAALYF